MEFIKNINNIFLSNNIYRTIYFIFLLLIIFLVKNFLTDIIIKIFNMNKKVNVRKNINHGIISTAIMLTLIYFSTNVLNLTENLKLIVYKSYRVSIIVIIALGIKNIISPNLKIFKNIREDKKANTMIDFIIKLIHVIIYTITGLIIIKELGYDVNAIIAGIGVGGIAIALGAQEIFKNFFSSLSLLMDKTFFIGDWIEIDKVSGIIEEITFRSVKVRTFDNALVNIPNNVIVNQNIINWSKMKKRKVKMNLVVTYDTTLLKLSKVVDEIRTMLNSNENISKDDIFVNFASIDDSGYRIMINYYTNVFQYREYLAIKETVNYNVMSILKKSKVELAYPTQTVNIGK